MSTPSKKNINIQSPRPTVYPSDDPNNQILRDEESGRILGVPTKMNYVTENTIEMHVRRDVTGDDSGIEFNDDARWDPCEVLVHNARGQPKTLKQNGFQLLDHPLEESVDFLDSQDVINNYYPNCEKLLEKVLGGKVTVKAFDHNVRMNTTGKKLKGAGAAKPQVPLGIVHGDYTRESGPNRLNDLGQPPKANDVLKERLGQDPLLNPDDVQATLEGKRRFALINVWRNIDPENPVQELPLACIDADTVDDEDLRTIYLHYKDRIGQNYFSKFSSKHRWCYFPQMTRDEVMLIQQWDSAGCFAKKQTCENMDGATFAVHSAFIDPTSPENAPPRQSIEVRCVIMWDVE